MKLTRLGAALLVLAIPLRMAFGQTPPDVDVNALVKTVNQLVQENAELKKRVADLEQRVSGQPPAPASSQATESATPPATDKGLQPLVPPEPSPAAETTSPAAADKGLQPLVPPTAGSQPEDKTPLRTYWKDGFRLETADEAFKLKIGGRIMVDVGALSSPDYWQLGGPAVREIDGAEFREARLCLSGSLYTDYVYQLEVDFAGNDVSIKDAYLGMKNIPVIGTVQAGHFTEPFGLEQMTTTNYTTFMERSMVTEALAPYRALGVGFTAPFLDERLTWAAGVFNRETDDKAYWDVTTRVTGLPWYEDNGRRLLHLGAAYMHETPNNYITLTSHPEAHLGNLHMNTGNFPAHTVDRWAFETALVVGPFSVQAEYMAAQADLTAPHQNFRVIDLDTLFESTRRFDGYYVQASWFLTGENRHYDKATGSFDRVVPRKNFTLALKGWGAVELAARYSTLDLDDFDLKSGVIGGEGRNWTVGLNWYMTPNTRLMLNYVKAHVEQLEYNGNIDIVQGRFQLDF